MSGRDITSPVYMLGGRPAPAHDEAAFAFESSCDLEPHRADIIAEQNSAPSGRGCGETGANPARCIPPAFEDNGREVEFPTRATVAALYVETGGCYFGLPGVDPWDEARDARLYDGPWPVVAHPPCDRWHMLSAVNHKRWGFKINEDEGCFAAALEAVRAWGGILEHPAQSRAFRFHGIPHPDCRGWQRTFDGDWITEVDQAAYGHRARKSTWLLYHGETPPPKLIWRETKGTHQVGAFDQKLPVMAKREALATPPKFRDLLLSIARSTSLPTRDGGITPPPVLIGRAPFHASTDSLGGQS